ncbi:MAG TPA: dephospho-CoA kinase [Gemmatimonadales bacterium]
MLNVALTGNVAAGKSTVLRWFAEWGASVIDADLLAREAQQPGTPTFDAIHARFGDTVIRSDGTLDRPALRDLVLRDRDALAALNAIVHPVVGRRRRELTAAAKARGDRIVVNDIPLLFEVMDPGQFDVVVLVDAPASVRRARLIHERGLDAAQADRLIAAQRPASAKRERSHVIIDNHGTRDDLRAEAEHAWRRLLDLARDAG